MTTISVASAVLFISSLVCISKENLQSIIFSQTQLNKTKPENKHGPFKHLGYDMALKLLTIILWLYFVGVS